MTFFLLSLFFIVLPLPLLPSYSRKEKVFVQAAWARNLQVAAKYGWIRSAIGIKPCHLVGILLRRRYCIGDPQLLLQRKSLLRYHVVFSLCALAAMASFAAALACLASSG
jgi:hypothetical protein